ncbi:MAG: methylenetetrahydrofolate reductase C-terminal domain-containing protein, partial [Christensenellaceae bacterium]|nr:methylenetetrahydrofolate reductase C-terminal domain-containing protein [Christensenellaceae bacterium]
HFFAGCVVTPFKNVEAEIITEYIKLEKKAIYADFIISQVGYDMRKFHELHQYSKEIAPNTPLIGNIFVLDKKLAELIHLHRFTGCTIPEKLYQCIMKEDRNEKEAGLLRAAKMFGIMKGMGYSGAHIGGEKLTADDIDFVITKGNEFAASWESHLHDFDGFDDGAFYYYHKDIESGLNTKEKNDLSKLPAEENLSLRYRLLRSAHEHIFEKKGPISVLASAVGRRSAKGGFVRGAERALRAGLFHCRDCGDCAMVFTDMICPMVHCPKQQRNGPCGGSRNGFCELYPNKKKCIYVTAYNRLKTQNKTDVLRLMVNAPNCGLYGTSELNNFFTGKDTYGKMKRKDQEK